MGPCVYDVDLEKYAQMTKEITDFLNGEDKTILHHLEDRMNKASEQLDFEQAKEYSCLLYTSPSPRDRTRSRMPSSA